MKYIRYKKEYVGNDTYRLYIKKNELEFLEKSLQRLETLKPICEVVETPAKKFRFLKVRGVVVYEFKNIEEYELFKEMLNNDKTY